MLTLEAGSFQELFWQEQFKVLSHSNEKYEIAPFND